MDGFREYPSDFDLPAAEVTAEDDVTLAIGTDERRMHVRAYNYWASLLEGRDFPSIEDLEPDNLKDFSGYSVLLDFTCGRDNPALPYVGEAIRGECGLDDDVRTIADVPSRSLLSRLTDHYMQIIANRAPVGFEAEFDNPLGVAICYRGILMPFSSDGDTIDFIYGVINWKQVGGAAQNVARAAALQAPAAPAAKLEPEAEGPVAADAHVSWDDGPLADDEAVEDATAITLDDDAGLADRLWAARETAESAKAGEGRTRAALYRALSLAYDFALAAEENPEEYSDLLEESGVTAQTRAPMTPIVKLVFGIDTDKARLTEFAAALSFASRQQLASGAFANFIEKQPGGLKAVVAAERHARRPADKADTKTDQARARLRTAPAISLADVSADEEFAVIVTRRGADGRHEPVAILDDEALVERALRRVA